MLFVFVQVLLVSPLSHHELTQFFSLVKPLARLGASVTGIDASSELIEVAQSHAKLDSSLNGRLTYVHTTAEMHVNEATEKYDAVVSSEVIEHVLDKNFFLEQCVRLLKVFN